MNKLLDKAVIFALCTLLYITFHLSPFHIVFLLVALTMSSACSYYDKSSIQYGILFTCLLLSIMFVDIVFFIPLFLYDTPHSRHHIAFYAFIIPFFIHFETLTLINTITIVIYILITMYLHWRSDQFNRVHQSNQLIKDESEEYAILQELRQKELLEKQDYQIELARSDERNRIAREIHDSVGHNLSSSLLQIGAMIAINKEEQLVEPLQNMKETLSAGMNSIRNSVHDLHEDTFHLKEEMQKIVDTFHFCNIDLQYRSSNLMNLRIKYCFINILKEALNNITKHSNATQVNITFIENPNFYQFSVWDNGTDIQIKDGLGLKSMEERVASFNGICTITLDKGFKIFINIPKEINHESNHRR